MDAPRLTIGRTLLPIAPFVAVIVAPNFVFLDVSSHSESRPTSVTTRYADGRSATETKQKDIEVVDLLWRLGPYALSSSTRTLSVFKVETGCSAIGEAASVSLLRARSWVAVYLFLSALVASIMIGRVTHWHSHATVPNSRFYPPLHTVGACMGILCALVIGFVLMKRCWPPVVSELVWWLRLSVTGVIPFFSIVIVTPVAEELVFRSGVCRVLVERIGPVAGILLQALLFGSLHLATPLHIAVGFIGGVVLGIVYVYSRSLNASIFLHAGANCVLAVACLITA